MATIDVDIPFEDWPLFDFGLEWHQGDHLTLIGPTSAGKTTLALHLLPRRDHTVVFATKKRDPLISLLEAQGYERITSADQMIPDMAKRYILAPPFGRGLRSVDSQRREFGLALDAAFRQTGWCIYLDEVPYVCDDLGLGRECGRLLMQGRSLGVTMAASAQRPVRIPLAFYSQARHLFLWQTNDERDLKTLGSLGGLDNRIIRAAVMGLEFDRHEVLHINTRKRTLTRTIPPKL